MVNIKHESLIVQLVLTTRRYLHLELDLRRVENLKKSRKLYVFQLLAYPEGPL